jgi:hypothetical protein
MDYQRGPGSSWHLPVLKNKLNFNKKTYQNIWFIKSRVVTLCKQIKSYDRKDYHHR